MRLERGIVRGFDVPDQGRQVWSWDPIPWAEGYEAANRRGECVVDAVGMDADGAWLCCADGERVARIISAEFSKGDNKWANSVVALKAATGEFVWGFRVVHHDLWDYTTWRRSQRCLHLEA